MKAVKGRPKDYGRFIYAFKHIRTRQVLYSFERLLQSRIINKQLPDLGANTRPPKIRKDLWKPFFTLIYPESENGYQRGLDAFTKLRQWRLLHEFHDEHPAESYRKRDEKEIKELETIIEDRGGNRKESAYDMIKRQNRSLRVRNIMDQHANSVADLAAVLLEQEKLAAREAERQSSLEAWQIVPTHLSKADRGLALIKRYERRIAELQVMKRKMPVRWRAGIDGNISPGGIRARIHELKARLASAMSAVPLIEQVREGLRAKLLAAREKGSLESIPKALNTLDPNSATLSIDPVMEKVGPGTRRHALAKLRQLVKPVETLKGVRIKWQEPFDSEFAAAWPEEVAHEPMGIVGHKAPYPLEPAFSDTIDLQRSADIYLEARNILAQETLEAKQAVAVHCRLVNLNEDGSIEIKPLEEDEKYESDELKQNEASATTATDRRDAQREADELEEVEDNVAASSEDDARIKAIKAAIDSVKAGPAQRSRRNIKAIKDAIAAVTENPAKRRWRKSTSKRRPRTSVELERLFEDLEGEDEHARIDATIAASSVPSTSEEMRV